MKMNIEDFVGAMDAEETREAFSYLIEHVLLEDLVSVLDEKLDEDTKSELIGMWYEEGEEEE
jgi:hypothetical protein